TSVSVPANATYLAGQSLVFTVNTSEIVTINTSGGTPRIALAIGSTTRYASYVGSSATALLFGYRVTADDVDKDGITVSATLDLNGGSIRDAATNSLNLTLPAVDTSGVLVASNPTVTDANI